MERGRKLDLDPTRRWQIEPGQCAIDFGLRKPAPDSRREWPTRGEALLGGWRARWAEPDFPHQAKKNRGIVEPGRYVEPREPVFGYGFSHVTPPMIAG
jgi:hypothetical protein